MTLIRPMGTCVSVKLSIRGSADDAKATKVIKFKSCNELSLQSFNFKRLKVSQAKLYIYNIVFFSFLTINYSKKVKEIYEV